MTVRKIEAMTDYDSMSMEELRAEEVKTEGRKNLAGWSDDEFGHFDLCLELNAIRAAIARKEAKK